MRRNKCAMMTAMGADQAGEAVRVSRGENKKPAVRRAFSAG
jgi:hypothetical protein